MGASLPLPASVSPLLLLRAPVRCPPAQPRRTVRPPHFCCPRRAGLVQPRGQRAEKPVPRSRGRPGLASGPKRGRPRQGGSRAAASWPLQAAKPPVPGICRPGLLFSPREAWLYLGLVWSAKRRSRSLRIRKHLRKLLRRSTPTRRRRPNCNPLPLRRPQLRLPSVSIGCLRPNSPVLQSREGIFSILLEETTVYYHFETRLFPASLALARLSSRLLARYVSAPLVRPQGLSGIMVPRITRPPAVGRCGVGCQCRPALPWR